ncbi:MAG: hypothetical protein QOD77_229 [Thermoplasmata archaeon]|nr:hypothetical protein [Thermoplasmata archaeon]
MTTPEPGPVVPVVDLNMTWNGCKMVGLGHTYPKGQNPGTPPSDWPPATGGVGSDVYVEAYQCERVSWGPYERPMTMVMESHTNLDPPEACRVGGWDTFQALASWWVSDRELADFMRTTYGIPVHHGAIDFLNETGQATSTFTATWNETGTEPSSMKASQVNQAEGHSLAALRFFWDWGNGTAMLDLQQDKQYSIAPTYVVQATMNPPMLLSSLGLPRMVARGAAVPHATLTGDLVLFGDRTCEEPLP